MDQVIQLNLEIMKEMYCITEKTRLGGMEQSILMVIQICENGCGKGMVNK